MTAREAYALLAADLAAAGIDSPQAEAWQLIEAVTGASRTDILTGAPELSLEEQRTLGEWLARRTLREPLQQIVGRSYFYGLELLQEPGVLIPRPETERLVEIALSLLEARAPLVLDVGCGTGAIALALKAERPDALVMACDISPAALSLTRRNALRLGLEIECRASDLLEDEEVGGFARRAQLVVSNPPYLPESDRERAQPEVRWDPEWALYAGGDGLSVYRELQRQACALLQPGSLLLVELDPRNVHAAQAGAAGWSSTRVHEDLTGRLRFLELRR